MKYRKFGRHNWEVSVLGLGVARLPYNESGDLDESKSVAIIRHAIDQGVNYLSLGHPYDAAAHQRRLRVISRALASGYREKVKIAATLPVSQPESLAAVESSLNQQLESLGMSVDFCLLGRITRENWPRISELGVLPWAERAMAEGRIGKLGFSFHDHYQVLRTLLQAYDQWSICEFQYSYMDVDHDPGVTGIQYAAQQGLAVVTTEPLRSGRLVRQLPPAVAAVWEKAPKGPSLAEWCLRFVWNHGEIATVVSDMSSLEEVNENAGAACLSEPDGLTVQELVLFGQAKDAYRKLRPINCPSCRACMPCPIGIDVPRIFELYNDAIIYGDTRTGHQLYRDEQQAADTCTQCGLCVRACAKDIPILDWLPPAHDLLG